MRSVQAEPKQVSYDVITKYLQKEMLETWGANVIHVAWEGLSCSVSLLLLRFCLYPDFFSPLCRVQLYCADQDGAGTHNKVAVIVTRRTKWLEREDGGLWECWKNCFQVGCCPGWGR